MLSMLSCSETSRTKGRPDASLGHPDGLLKIRLLLSCKLRRIFLESGNCLLDACDTDICHIKAFPELGFKL
jgi:hypothetical protein